MPVQDGKLTELKSYLDHLVSEFENVEFIDPDPISIPHAFEDPLDQEIIGLFAAVLAWGQRKTLLKKLEDLCERMEYKPRKFVQEFNPNKHGHIFTDFIYRTFQPVDAISLISNLSQVISEFGSLERIFSKNLQRESAHIESALQKFSDILFEVNPDSPKRLRKHLARPSTGSACKRLCMYLRWMTRPGPVDLGIWKSVNPSQLILPVDIHSGRQARQLGMLNRKQNDWKAALELTENCLLLCAEDPCKYDFAFFGIGVNGGKLDARFIGENRVNLAH